MIKFPKLYNSAPSLAAQEPTLKRKVGKVRKNSIKFNENLTFDIEYLDWDLLLWSIDPPILGIKYKIKVTQQLLSIVYNFP